MKAEWIDIPSVTDERGSLAFAEAERCVPFPVKRVFWIYDIPEGARRGGHVHWSCSEVVVALKGGFTMVLDDAQERISVRVDNPTRGLLVPAGIWCELIDFDPETLVVVMASEEYNSEGYTHDYETYKKTPPRRSESPLATE